MLKLLIPANYFDNYEGIELQKNKNGNNGHAVWGHDFKF